MWLEFPPNHPTLALAIAGCAAAAAVLVVVLRRLGFCLPAPANEYEAFHREVRRRLGCKFCTLLHCNHFKHEGVARFAWAIPNAAAVNAVLAATAKAAAGPSVATTAAAAPCAARLVDFGAGSGYWAHVLAQRAREARLDVDVIAIEKSLNLYAKRPDGSIGLPAPGEGDGGGGGGAGVGAGKVAREDLWYDVQPGDLATLAALQRERPVHTLLLVWPPCWEDMAHDAVQAFCGGCVVYVGEERGGCTVSIPNWHGRKDRLHVYVRGE